MEITVTLSLAELMQMPGDGIIRIMEKANPPADFLRAAADYEMRPLHGKGRWVICNHIRERLKKTEAAVTPEPPATILI